jgi:hypothetical protein
MTRGARNQFRGAELRERKLSTSDGIDSANVAFTSSPSAKDHVTAE